MCGIVVTIGEHSKEKTLRALDRLKHRGDDDISVVSINSNFSIGFRRFAINDASINGRQPFLYKNSIGVFNGEIYNYAKLKREYSLDTISISDTEVILPLYEKFKDDFYPLIDGMFAGVIINKSNNEIIVIKDLVGEKPLFLVKSGDDIFFISELKALSQKIDSVYYIKSGISKFNTKGELLSVNYQQYKYQGSNDSALDVHLYNILNNSVHKRIPDERFGIFLSGGLDSSIIAYLALKRTKNIMFYSLIDNNSSDYEKTKELVRYLKIDSQNIKYINIPNSNKIKEIIDKVVYHTESYNPSIISNGIGSYLLSKEAKNDGIKVILSGEGADEVFCGYKSFFKNGNYKPEWQGLRTEFIENLHFTELRRVDLCTMANTIEARSPFLDKEVIKYANELNANSFFKGSNGKQILRENFKEKLPLSIIEREKTSFDVGSGLRRVVVKFLRRNNKTEKEELKIIWNKYFNNYISLSKDEYFHSYPSFNKVIETRKSK